jgi:hypothetical protein
MISESEALHIRTLANIDGDILPATVVADARDPKSPIHHKFNWNVQEAAMEHWLDTAQGLIRFVKLRVEIDRRTVVAPFYVVKPNREPRSHRYVELTIASRDRDMAFAIMIAECDRIAAAIRRAQEVCHVLGLRDELDELLADAAAIRTSTERRRDEAEKKRAAKKGKGKSSGKRSSRGSEMRV